jgi:hypothetical protein
MNTTVADKKQRKKPLVNKLSSKQKQDESSSLAPPTQDVRGRRSCTVSTTKPTSLRQFAHKQVFL